MPADSQLLTTLVECDEADAALDAELDGYQTKDAVNDYGDRQDSRHSAADASRLVTLNNRITSLTNTLADPATDAKARLAAEGQLLTANYQKAKLGNRAAARTGSAAFLGEVDVDQNDKQVEVLLGAKAKVAARRIELGG